MQIEVAWDLQTKQEQKLQQNIPVTHYTNKTIASYF